MIFYNLSQAAVNTGIVFFMLVLCSKFLFIILAAIKKRKFLNEWACLILDTAYQPVQLLLWIFGLLYLYDVVGCPYLTELHFGKQHFNQVTNIVYSLIFCWFLIRLQKRLETYIKESQKKSKDIFDPMLILMVSQISKVIIIGIVVGIVLYILGIPFQSLMMFQGAVSLAVGLAAKNVLANGIAGLMILINQPFKVGDWISSPDKKIDGCVEEIRWDATKIMNKDRRPFYVPNSMFTQIILMNSSKMYNRHILQNVNLRYKDVDLVDAITSDIKNMLKTHADIDQKQVAAAEWVSFGPKALRIEVTAFTKTTNDQLFRQIQQDVCMKIAQIVKKHGAEIAMVTQSQ